MSMKTRTVHISGQDNKHVCLYMGVRDRERQNFLRHGKSKKDQYPSRQSGISMLDYRHRPDLQKQTIR